MEAAYFVGAHAGNGSLLTNLPVDPGDNLGNHVATTTLNMNFKNIVNVSTVGMTGSLTLNGSSLTVTGKDASGYSLSLSSGITMAGGTVNAGLIQASSGVFTAVGPAYSIQTSSGIKVGGTGGVIATFFSGAHYGSGAGLTGVPGDQMGNHVATTTLNMNYKNLVNAATMTVTGSLTLNGSTLTVTGGSGTNYSITASSGVSIGNGSTGGSLKVNSPATEARPFEVYENSVLAVWLKKK